MSESSNYDNVMTGNTYRINSVFSPHKGPVMRSFNTLRPRQNVRLFADDTFKRIFLNENIIISIKISLTFVPKSLINNIPALVLIMAWRRPGDKPLSEPMLVKRLTHICVTRPQWVNILLMLTWVNCCRNSQITVDLKHHGALVTSQ